MNENHHTFEPHTESAADHFCDQCFGYHDWRAGCAEEPLEIEPHDALTILTPDTVAECWDGVFAFGDLYETLWSCVPDYTAPSPEESEEPCHGMDSVADFWDRFSDAQKLKLNELAAAATA